MKFFHLSDLHIGLKLFNKDLQEEQIYILKQIADRAKEIKPDAIIIAGDVYDKAIPSAEAVSIFDEFINDISVACPEANIMMISGNHDSAPRLDLYRNILARHKMYMIGNPPENPDDYIEKVVLDDDYGNVNFYLLPFVKPSMVKKIVGTDENGNNLSYNDSVHKLIEREDINNDERNVIVSHQFYLPIGDKADNIVRMDSEIVTVGNVDEVKADILERFDYAALGHIHQPMKVGSEFYRYCGTPLACSVSEAGQQKGIVVVDMKEKGNIKIEVIPLIPKKNVRKIEDTLENILKQPSDDYVTVVLTDDKDLNTIEMNDRLRNAFPNLLEIRRKALKKETPHRKITSEKEMDPFEMCCAFAADADEESLEILKEVINTVKGVN